LPAAKLIEDLSNASKRGHLHESLATYIHSHAPVIDEVGNLTYRPAPGKVLNDEDMAAATLGRVLERGRFFHLDWTPRGGEPIISTRKRPCQKIQNGSEFPGTHNKDGKDPEIWRDTTIEDIIGNLS
jgi:hypothetical protein